MGQIFPPSWNKLPLVAAIAGTLCPTLAIAGVWYYFSPWYTDVGYRPVQPVPYSHQLHVGELGLDCRYCHASAEVSAVANVPPTQTCMNCHHIVQRDSAPLAPIRESAASGRPMRWIRVHKVPEYAYFPHHAHVTAGIGCVTCHGRVDEMEIVTQMTPLSMSWCLDCHRNPGPQRRPVSEVTNMKWTPPRDVEALAARLSYFLWNSEPDDALRALAQRGELRRPGVLRAQTDRLLNHPNSRKFVNAFLDYWLDLRSISATSADEELYPDYQLDDYLPESMTDETQLFFAELLKSDLGAANLVKSDFAILNERLAKHYKIPNVNGAEMRKVTLPKNSVRGGLLTQASVLKVTANGTTGFTCTLVDVNANPLSACPTTTATLPSGMRETVPAVICLLFIKKSLRILLRSSAISLVFTSKTPWMTSLSSF